MIKRKRFFGLLCLVLSIFCLSQSEVYSQDGKVEVEISTNKVIIDGVVYYVHMVKKGQTLYSICKAYNVPESSVVKVNPGADEEIKEGQALKIPTNVAYDEVVLNEKDKYIYHIIQPGQTLYFLTKKYNVSQEEIEKYNPEVKYDELQVNQVLKIPRSKATINKTVKPQDTSYIYYRVKKRETLYSLTRRFEVTEEQIREANTDLKHGILKEGQIVRIPKPIDSTQIFVDVQPIDSILLPLKDSLVINLDSLRALCDSFDYFKDPVAFNVAIMLPFCTNEREIILHEDLGNSSSDEMKYYRLKKLRMLQEMMYSFSEFYEGALLAVDDMKEEGLNINLYVYDTQRDSSRVKKLIKQKEFKTMDLIIGPVYCHCLEALYENLDTNQVNLVSPFCNTVRTPSANPVYLINPNNELLYERIADLMIENKDEKLIVVYSGDSNSIKERDLILNHFKEHEVPDSLYEAVIYNDTADYQIYSSINKSDTNYMLILTEDDIYLSKVIAKLNLMMSKYVIKLYGLPSWTKLMNIDYEFYHQLGFTYGTPFQSCSNESKFTDFQKVYFQYFETLPCRTTSDGYGYALMGYDIMHYFLSALKRHGKHFEYCFEEFITPQISSAFEFIQDADTKYYLNCGVTYNRFTDDYEVKVINKEVERSRSSKCKK